MPRLPRIHIPDAFYHVMLRGNSGNAIFFNDEDYRYFYHLLEQGMKKYPCEIHAFCCMTNHVHLLIRVQDISLSKIMHDIAFKYAAWINYKQKRKGHVFQGRFKSIWVDKDSYLLQLVRYIHRNPLEAGIVDNLMDYPWSSHLTYINQQSISWLTTDKILGQLSPQPDRALKCYYDLISDSVNYEQQFNKLKSLEEIEKFLCNKYGILSRDLIGNKKLHHLILIREEFVYLAIKMKLASQKQLAQYLKLTESAISKVLRRVKNS